MAVLNVNGKALNHNADPRTPLLWVLREQLGLVGASALPSYADLPQLAVALRGKFTAEETAKLLGGNYRRVFEACMG